MKENIKNINSLFTVNAQENPQVLLEILTSIIPFEKGIIFLSDYPVYFYGNEAHYNEKLTGVLSLNNAPFGEIEISRNKKFTENEEILFDICKSIIANRIKDIEIAKIINLQVEALQEGIAETNKAYQTEKTKNDFFANFSHEIRTPLNSVISSSELLAEQIFGELNDKQLEYINDIRIAGLHLLGMINDILDLSKLEANSMKLNTTEFSANSILCEVCNILKPLAGKKNIEIRKHVEDIKIYADYQKIQQILFNLINNAIKYTPKNGKIEITINQTTSGTLISVKDNGIGIDKKYQEKIFDKFVQLGSQKNSNGLGLTITRELIKLHNGTIKVISEPGKGTEFIVQIP